MIARLRGPVWERAEGRLVVGAGGVGYEVLIPEGAGFPEVGQDADLHIRHVVREDGHYLYGFTDAASRALFDQLTEVKGCGPRISLSLLATLGGSGIVAAIGGQDAKALARANGVGPRLAERILVELRDKVAVVAPAVAAARPGPASPPPGVDPEVVEALMALGYRRLEAEAAVAASVQHDAALAAAPAADRVRAALRRLAK